MGAGNSYRTLLYALLEFGIATRTNIGFLEDDHSIAGGFVRPMLHQLPADLAKKDADSRERWSVAAFVTLKEQLSYDGLKALIAAGKPKFFADARLAYKRQDFREDDYERMWRLLNHHFSTLQHSPPQGITLHG